MPDFITFPESQEWKNVGQENKIDGILETIVANARKYKQYLETSHPGQSYHFNVKKDSGLKSFSSQHPLQLQYFNPTPAFVTRKRKNNSSVMETSSNDERSLVPVLPKKPTIYETSNYFDVNNSQSSVFFRQSNQLKTKKQDTASPIPDFIVKDFPEKGTVLKSSSSWVRTKEIEQSAVELLIQMDDDSNRELTTETLSEEPVKNSMFWHYRNFPHIK